MDEQVPSGSGQVPLGLAAMPGAPGPGDMAMQQPPQSPLEQQQHQQQQLGLGQHPQLMGGGGVMLPSMLQQNQQQPLAPGLAPLLQQQMQQQQHQLQQQQQMQQLAMNVVPTVPRQPLPKQLTAAIKSASNVERLAQLFNDHAALLNPIHVAAMITKLPKLEATAGVGHLSVSSAAGAVGTGTGGVASAAADGALPWLPPAMSASRALLAQLLGKIKQHDMSEYSPRGLANIVWALAKLQHYPDPELQARLLDTFVERLPAAVPQVGGAVAAALGGFFWWLPLPDRSGGGGLALWVPSAWQPGVWGLRQPRRSRVLQISGSNGRLVVGLGGPAVDF